MIFAFLVFLAIFTFICYLYKLITPPARLRKFANDLPGPKAWPIVGNGLDFLLTTKSKCIDFLFRVRVTRLTLRNNKITIERKRKSILTVDGRE